MQHCLCDSVTFVERIIVAVVWHNTGSYAIYKSTLRYEKRNEVEMDGHWYKNKVYLDTRKISKVHTTLLFLLGCQLTVLTQVFLS